MQRLMQTYLVWLLVALFVISAGHGILSHADHDHGPSDCALCVLVWMTAIASVTSCVPVALSSHVCFSHRRNLVPKHLRVHALGQRAPPASTLQ
jgi:hypothetical protein